MKTRVAALREVPGRWEILQVDLDPPKTNEVLVRMVATGYCHSDDHFATGDTPVGMLPFVGGHEGAGIVEEVGPGVEHLKPGDHVVTSFIPACGRCRWCASGQQNLCDNGALMLVGHQLDGTFRMHHEGRDVAQAGCISAFSEYSVMPAAAAIKIDPEVPLSVACLTGCGVPTGWGSAVRAADIKDGDVVIVMGVGGVGMNAVQGARYVGASRVIAVDPVEMKQKAALDLGATDAVASMSEATELAKSVTNGQGADAAIVTVGVGAPEHFGEAFAAISKGGTMVATSVGPAHVVGMPISLIEISSYQKRIQGALFGMGSPAREIPRLIEHYKRGDLKLDELVTKTYSLDEINQAAEDLRAGANIRGAIAF